MFAVPLYPCLPAARSGAGLRVSEPLSLFCRTSSFAKDWMAHPGVSLLSRRSGTLSPSSPDYVPLSHQSRHVLIRYGLAYLYLRR